MAEPFAVLLDQNVPRAVADWLRQLRPSWDIHHATDDELVGSLVIIDRTRIRVRPPWSSGD